MPVLMAVRGVFLEGMIIQVKMAFVLMGGIEPILSNHAHRKPISTLSPEDSQAGLIALPTLLVRDGNAMKDSASDRKRTSSERLSQRMFSAIPKEHRRKCPRCFLLTSACFPEALCLLGATEKRFCNFDCIHPKR